MTRADTNPELPAEIRTILAAVRWRIRGYVWLQGLSVAALWLGLTFWLGLAIDYLPVLAGAGEMPQVGRAVLLASVALLLAGVLYRWVLRRTFIALGDRSMAVLLERRFPWFRDSLITSVEMAGKQRSASRIGQALLARTQQDALSHLPRVRVRRIFALRPLALSVLAAVAVSTTVVGLYVANAEAFQIGIRRLYLLRNEPWPRNARIEVVGVEMQQASGEQNSTEVVVKPFRDRHVKVARGSSVRLLVRADAAARKIPDTCTISYRTADGDRGKVRMTRVGRIRNGSQSYQYDAKPLKDILTDVRFEVVGFDHRLPEHEIEVVDRPTVVGCVLECVFPRYMVDESTSSWLPRSVALTAGTQLPLGTTITLRAEANKELEGARITHAETGETAEGVLATETRRSFTYALPPLTQSLGLDITLTDTDEIAAERPYRVFIAAVADEPPVVDVRLAGVGTAVTPDVAIPFRGTIRDDYGLARAWIEVGVNDKAPRELPLSVGSAGAIDARTDFREQRAENGGLALQPKDALNLVVKAVDRYDLGSQPNVGLGDHYRFDVVTPDELLARLEAREIGLRQRFEQIIEETTETRDMLSRVKNEGPAATVPGTEPGDVGQPGSAETGDAADAAGKKVWSVRLLRAQQAILQAQKSAQETLGVAAGFRDIRDELVNNRVDTEDRKQRLEQQLAQPLERIGGELFPEFDRRLQRLVDKLDAKLATAPVAAGEDPDVVSAADSALEEAAVILLAMNEVLENMLNLETYNELLDIVRSVLTDEERLINETKKQQKKQALELLQ